MSFVQIEFLWFFVVVLAIYWALPRRGQNLLLVLASLAFCGWVHPWFAVPLLFSSSIDFLCARGMQEFPKKKRVFLRLSLAGNVLMLGTFKYLDFFIENFAAVLHALGLGADIHTLDLLLPLGISFYTFQTVGYTIDVYRGRVRARSSFLDYLVYVSFFPQLVAGPIERASHLLPQVERDRVADPEAMFSGLGLALWGAFKKVVIADTVAQYVNAIYATDQPSWAMAWAASIGFIVQILADFTGYTDIARGTARMLGFRLVKNFDHPYLATSAQDLWGRWHISLSSWLRDYIFYPASTWRWARKYLRVPFMRETGMSNLARATAITMMFSGLWHGAAWHFVLWGAFWTVVQVAFLYGERKIPRSLRRWKHRRWVMVIAMFPIHMATHQLFREPQAGRLLGYFFGNPLDSSPDQLLVALVMLEMALLCASVLVLAMLFEMYVLPRLRRTAMWLPVQTSLWCVAAWAIFTFARQTQNDFVYFAF